MKNCEELRYLLEKIDHRGYPAYKETRGSYRFPGFILDIIHVQGDPFASPSRVAVRLSGREAGFPEEYVKTRERRTALEDYLLRRFGGEIASSGFRAGGSGKSGLILCSRPGQEILERSASLVNAATGEVRILFFIGFPAYGRTIAAGELIKILFDFLPGCVSRALEYRNQDKQKLQAVIDLADDQAFLREELIRRNWCAFVADGAVLPRKSGVSELPLKDAVVFTSPETLRQEVKLPHRGKVAGMAIPRGITLIAGGGYHGKSTLLQALQAGVYNHIAGDGRELVITDDTAVKIRAEDGRSVRGDDISLFIRNLPGGKDTKRFSTENASGSTSQAASVVEALEAGSQLFLIDEDTCATNFMVRDRLMQEVVSPDKEPIMPFIARMRSLFLERGVSCILAVGSSGAFFGPADLVIQMDHYRAKDITALAKEALKRHPEEAIEGPEGLPEINLKRIPGAARKPGGREAYRGGGRHGDDRTKIKLLGDTAFSLDREEVDLRFVEQIADREQTAALALALDLTIKELMDGRRSIAEIAGEICRRMDKEGLIALSGGDVPRMDMARPRKQEIVACLSRYRG